MIRVASGLVLFAFVVGAIWFLHPFALLVLAEIAALLAFREYARLAGKLGARVPRAGAATATLATCAAMAWPGVGVDVVIMTATIGLAALVLASGRAASDALHDVAASLLAPLYIGVPLGALVAIRTAFGREATLLLLLTVVASDTAQFYTGRVAGRRLLAPAISPKKTVEGAIGGVAAGALTMVVMGHWWLDAVSASWRFGLGLAVVTAGIAGDLFESLLKRGAAVKDSSAMIPGHGGILDRIDALLFAAPIYYIFVRFVG